MSERAAEALRLRRQGLTFKEVGQRLGVGVNQARQLCLRGERLEKEPRTDRFSDKMSTRIRNALKAAGHDPDNTETLRELVQDDAAWRKIPNFGLLARQRVAELLNVEIHEEPAAPSQEYLDRCRATLERSGYTVIPPGSGDDS